MDNHIGSSIKAIFKTLWNETFIVDLKDRTITYKEFFHDILKLKIILENEGLGCGAKICLVLDNSYWFLVYYFTILAIGGVAIPIDPNKGTTEVEEIINDVCPDYIVDTVEDGLANTSVNEEKENCLEIWDAVDYSSLFLITFTSGTTGRPKGVCHSFKNIYSASIAFKNACAIKKRTHFAHLLPMGYMAGILNSIFLPFLSRCSIVLFERFSVANCGRFWERSSLHCVQNFWITPTIVSLLLKIDRGDCGIEHCRQFKPNIFVGTSPLYEEVKEQFEKRYNVPLYESYGLSETLFISANSSKYPVKKRSVGQLLSDVYISIATDNEILLRVPWNYLGYLGHDETSHVFDSGDLGRCDSEGYLFIEGRKKDVIIRGGINVSPNRIENYILSSNLLSGEVAVIGAPDLIIGEKTICAYTDSAADLQQLKSVNRGLLRDLGKDSIIDLFKRVTEIPRNTNLKVDKNKLREMIQKA